VIYYCISLCSSSDFKLGPSLQNWVTLWQRIWQPVSHMHTIMSRTHLGSLFIDLVNR